MIHLNKNVKKNTLVSIAEGNFFKYKIILILVKHITLISNVNK